VEKLRANIREEKGKTTGVLVNAIDPFEGGGVAGPMGEQYSNKVGDVENFENAFARINRGGELWC